jgi:hypothetical protein
MILQFTIILLIAVIIIQAIINRCERRDMLNRLMSKNLTEYRQDDRTPPKPIPSAHDRVLKKWRNRAGDE